MKILWKICKWILVILGTFILLTYLYAFIFGRDISEDEIDDQEILALVDF